ncbi:MAG: hypothetical protein ACLTKG_06900 [Collinsella intestinalis]
MSRKSKRDMTPEELAELKAEDERAMEAARELRARREAVQGPRQSTTDSTASCRSQRSHMGWSLRPCSPTPCRVLVSTG